MVTGGLDWTRIVTMISPDILIDAIGEGKSVELRFFPRTLEWLLSL